MKKIAIAADSFKGSLSSREFADICADTIISIIPNCEITKIPLGDGGEGTVEALTANFGGKTIDCVVIGPMGEETTAIYGISADSKTAIMEIAQASGLPLVKDEERNPLNATTFGTGQMIADALERGCRKFLIGIGGSATNDGGLGMLKALGFRFYDSHGNTIDGYGTGHDLEIIESIDSSAVNPAVAEAEFIVACDVDNPFCGERGAARVFAPQKGADPDMVERLDAGMAHFASTIYRHNGINIANYPGAGAAGGLGGAFKALLNAKLKRGIDMVLEAVAFNNLIAGADLIITGEGRIDYQTIMGKTPYGVLCAAKRQNIPVVALGGSVEHCNALDNAGFAGIFSIQQRPMTLTEALDRQTTCENLRSTVYQIIRLINVTSKRTPAQ